MPPIPLLSPLLISSTLAFACLLAAPSESLAESSAAPAARAPSRAEAKAEPLPSSGFSIGLNPPFRWAEGNVAGSMSLGFRRHHALRANLATYAPFDSESGAITDVGAGWVYYPRRLWSGFNVEAGALVRGRDLVEDESDDFDDITVATDSHTYAGRLLFGWSWRITSSFYFATALGFSVGYELGEETTFTIDHERGLTSEVRRVDTDLEAYFRFGFALDG